MAIGTTFGSTGHDRGTWLVLLFLLVGVAAPTGCVLWFMNQAAESQAASARQSVLEAYHGQLQQVRDRVDGYWKSRAAEIEMLAGAGVPGDFDRMLKYGLADSFVFVKADGVLAYPFTPSPQDVPLDDSRARTLEGQRNWPAAINAYSVIAKSDASPAVRARAAQGQIRGLLKESNKEGAVVAILEYFGAGKLVRAADSEGRMIAADEHLLALRLMGPKDPRRNEVLRRLTGWLSDYRMPMPSAQRLFLMGEALGSGATGEKLPTLEAERLAAQYLEADSARTPGRGLQETRLASVWRLPVKSGQVIALFRNQTVENAIKGLLEKDGPRTVQFTAVPPGSAVTGDSLPAGSLLPGWQISLSLRNTSEMEEASERRRATYLWVGYVVIACMILSGLLVGQVFRRQLRLAKLKTDLVAAVSHELKTPLASMRLLVDSLLEDEELDPSKTREYLALISGENLRLTRLIENFLTFSRIERKRQRFEFMKSQPASIVQTAVNSVRERFEQPGCSLDIQVEPDLPAIQADADAMVTVLINLLDNAFKYTRGEKRIRVRVFGPHPDGWCLTGNQGEAAKHHPSGWGHSVTFVVQDNGIGIDAREQRRIFRKFYQVDQRLARDAGGCGLGLSIVDTVVKAHGGTVSVESRLGEGSTFAVSVPCLAPRVPANASTEEQVA